MKIVMPEHVRTIIRELKKYGYDAYAVGGCVRDSVLGRQPQDWDITTSARPEEIKEVFAFTHTIDTGIQHGTVTVMMDHIGYEITTYRIDGEYEDARHPKQVTFTGDLLDDLKRRDFTINAMAYNEEAGFVDAFDGLGDLQRGIIRCVGEPKERFGEDALRMLRAVRFAAQLGFTIDPPTFSAIKELAPSLARISAERIQAEMVKLLTSPHPEAMRLVYESGMADVFLPEFSLMMKTEQNHPHHCYSVGEHTIHTLMAIRADRLLRLAMLFHDIGKPACRRRDEKGIDHFHGHPEKSAQMAKEILRRLKFDNATIQAVVALVRAHDHRPVLSDYNVRMSVYEYGEDCFPDLFEVKYADVAGQSDYYRAEKLDYIRDFQQIYQQEIQAGNCLSLKDLAVTGKDLIDAGMQPGKELGMVLQQMLMRVLEDPSANTKEHLMSWYMEEPSGRD